MNANRIQLGAIVARNGELLLVRVHGETEWQIPGGH